MQLIRFFLYTLLALPLVAVECIKEPPQAYIPTENSEFISRHAFSSVSLDRESPFMIEGVVHPQSGQLQRLVIDLAIPGLEPLQLERSWIHNFSSLRGELLWDNFGFNHFSHLEYKGHEFELKDGLGSVLSFSDMAEKKDGKKYYRLFSDVFEQGLTNCSTGIISGKTNLKNFKLIRDDGRYIVQDGAGSKKIYKKTGDDRDQHRLIEEIHPSGAKTRYKYHKDWGLKEVTNLTKLDEVINSFQFHFSNEKIDGRPFFDVKSSNHHRVRYHLTQNSGRHDFSLLDVYSDTEGHECFSSKTKDFRTDWVKFGRADDRYTRYDFYNLGDNNINGRIINISRYAEKNKNHEHFYLGRVKRIKAPVGHDATPIVTHSFVYDLKVIEKSNNKPRNPYNPENPNDPYAIPKEPQCPQKDQGPIKRLLGKGSTNVFDAYGHLTTYAWNSDFRMIKLIKHTGKQNHQVYTKEHLHWGEGSQKHLLWSRNFEEEGYGSLFCRQFHYDSKGNILRDELWGNLTGHSKKKVKMDGKRAVHNGTDCYVKQYDYSHDGFNNMLYETDGDYQIWFSYLPESNVLASKLMGTKNKILKREFYSYNPRNDLVQEVIDDGSGSTLDDLTGVKTRLIIKYTPLDVAPFGLPIAKEIYYLDLQSGQEVLHGRSEYEYNYDGLVTCEKKFGSDRNYAMAAYWEYDKAGNLIKEINPLGHLIEREYDVHHNMTVERRPQEGSFKKIKYDFVNRPICVEEHHQNGVVLSTSNHWNYLHQQTAAIDIYGNKKTYLYDSLGRIIEEHHPVVAIEGGQFAIPKFAFEYDAFGNLTRLTDPSGYEEHRKFSIRGHVAESWDHEGMHEKNTYHLNGTLAKKVDCKGNTTHYFYDCFQRIIKVEMFDPHGERLKQTQTEWSAFNKIREIDEKGIETKFTYNGANQLLETTKGTQKTSYVYNTIGQLERSLHYYGDQEGDFYAKCYVYDLIGQVLEERIEDSSGNIQKQVKNEYDSHGRVIAHTEYFEGGASVHQTYYNSFGLIEKQINPLGQITRYEYDFFHRNPYGQTVLLTRQIEPNGLIIEKIHNTAGKTALERVKNSLGDLLKLTEREFDLNGNCTLVKESQIIENKIHKEILTRTLYDRQNRAIGQVEAYQTELQKETHLQYNAFNEKIKETLPSGLELYYTYDAIGRLIEYQASDHSFHYSYQFENHLLKSITDHIQGTVTTKNYDSNEYLSSETLGNGLRINYSVDRLGRVVKVGLTDGSGVLYEYHGNRLIKVQRSSPTDQIVYEHGYTCYDLSGKVLEEKLASGLGTLKRHFDTLGRIESVKTSFHQETIDNYDLASNIIEKSTQDAVGKQNIIYNFDGLNQLTLEKCDKTVQTYSFDSLQNRLSKNGKLYQLNDLFELLSDGETDYCYDAQGCRVLEKSPDEEIHYRYDALGRLITIIKQEATIGYLYDAENRRLSKTITLANGQQCIEKFLYAGPHEIGLVDENGDMKEFRMLGIGLGAEIGASVALELNHTLYIPLHDHIGNVTMIIDPATQKAHETYRYTAFGEETLYDAHQTTKKTALNPWRFSSKRADAETGFIYFGRRYLDTSIGRWVTPDPKGFAAGPNLYAFVNNNPLNFIDLFGLQAEGGFLSTVRDWFSNLFSSNAESNSGEKESYLSKAWGYLKSTIKAIEWHFNPLPCIREAVRTVCNYQSKRSSGITYVKPVSSIARQLYRPEMRIDLRFLFINGILNTLMDCKNSAKHLSEILGGFNVFYTYNSGNGMSSDIAESGLNKLGIATRAAFVMAAMITDVARELGLKGTIVLVAHSQGAAITKLALDMISENVKKMCSVVTCGAAALISSKGLKDAINFVSYKDPVPFICDPINIMRSLFDPNMKVTFLNSSDTFGVGHEFCSSAYTKALTQHLKGLGD